ncbi:MAG: ABC transporter ATP-binding protein [Actinomycetota bacterium]|nr:ABC transporter ATP-binding protein [Actinomycetota bacterium]
MAELPVHTAGLRKVYGSSTALEGLDLEVHPGEVVGLLGANGAGKTTTVKILLGLVAATAGEASLFGRRVADPQARRQVGYLPEHFRFPDWLTGAELLDYHGRLAGMPAADRRARIPEVLERVGLAGRGNQRLRSYSKGMTQRVGLAQAVFARPRLVLLDEPTSALDPIGRREVRDLIRDLREEGVAVLLNSHLLGEVELVCDRVAIVDRGRVVRAGRLDAMIGAGPQIRVRLDRVDERALAILGGLGEVMAVDDTTVVLAAEGTDPAAAVAAELVRAGYGLQALIPVHRSLEDIFVGLVSESSG